METRVFVFLLGMTQPACGSGSCIRKKNLNGGVVQNERKNRSVDVRGRNVGRDRLKRKEEMQARWGLVGECEGGIERKARMEREGRNDLLYMVSCLLETPHH